MNLLDLIHADGGELKKAATTNGGEYGGPCPWCGGRDRFRVWPESGRYWCRGCDKSGDTIQYLRDKRGLSYVDACRYLGNEPKERKHPETRTPETWSPGEAKAPGELWQRNASAFLDMAVKALWAPSGAPVRQWLNAEKGLNDTTIKKARLGHSRTDLFDSRASWGLSGDIIDGKEKRLWIPAGLVLPLMHDGGVHRLRIRRDNPSDGKRYIFVSGSSPASLKAGAGTAAAVIVESELDALLIAQEAGDLMTAISMGTAQSKPDAATHAILKDTPLILVCLDTDDAGAKASWKFWPETYGGKVRRWPTIHGKDASDARLKGLNIRQWIIAGMFGTEERFERFCIQTIDGGLSDREAINLIGS